MKQAEKVSCQNCKAEFVIEAEDFEFYEKMDAPQPTFCPDCRAQRRFAVWNDRKIYTGKDDITGEEIFTEYSEGSPATVCDKDYWISDKWDPMDYGRDYDFSKPFFQQVKELFNEVPRPNFTGKNMVNSEYCKNVTDIKDCYLTFSALETENCSYGYRVHGSTDLVDCMNINNCNICHQDFMLKECYQAFFSSHCESCQNITFCNNCSNCSDCFGCSNLKHKKYHIFNKEYSKEEYLKKVKEFDTGSFAVVSELKKEAKKHHLKFPTKYALNSKNTNVTGECIENSKNVRSCYSIVNGENLKYSQFMDSKYLKSDSYDESGYGINTQRALDCLGAGDGSDMVKYCWMSFTSCINLEYCYQCRSSSNLFGCAGLRHKEYCILNKQYTKEEYEELVPKIKAQMNEMPYTDRKGNVYKYGEFFPPELSPFGYNETLAQEFFPLTKEQALEKGYRWYEKPKGAYKPTVQAKDLPDHIKDVDRSILEEVIGCGNESEGICQGSGAFKVTPSELEFYQKHNFPLPRLCPDCRHAERIKQRNPMKLHKRQCMCGGEGDATGSYQNQTKHKHGDHQCSNTFQTTYDPERPEIIYCKECYQREVE